jgi:DNA-directed RNA polymerase subunit beta'
MVTVGGGTVRFEGTTPDALRVCWGARVMERFEVPRGARVLVRDGDEVPPDTWLVDVPWWFDGGETACLDGGLETVRALLDARIPAGHRPAAVAPCDGVVAGVEARAVVIRDDAGRDRRVPIRRDARVREGERVRTGERLTEGWRSHHGLLRAWGEARLRAHLLDELEVFGAHCAEAPPRAWWAVLLRAMTSWRRVTRPGDSALRRNALLSQEDFARAVEACRARSATAPEAVPVLRGLSSLARRR